MMAEPSLEARAAPGARFDRLAAELGRWSVAVMVGLLAGAAVLLLWRRLVGALSGPLETYALLAVGATVAALAVLVRILWQRLSYGSAGSRLHWPVVILPSLVVAATGAALTYGRTPLGAQITFWGLLLAEEIWAWRPGSWRRLKRRPAQRTGPSPPQEPPASAPVHASLGSSLPPIPADGVLQQLTRVQAADGSERLSGLLRALFEPGQRTASVHVAFCPPFPKTPELSADQLAGPPARIKTALLLPHGVRLDLKLAAVAEDAEKVLLQISARSRAAQ